MREQTACLARILRGDEVNFLEDTQGTQRDVL